MTRRRRGSDKSRDDTSAEGERQIAAATAIQACARGRQGRRRAHDELFRQAVLEHAKFLGMDPEIDERFLYIAEEALTAPLPPNWEQGISDDGSPYHYNTTTGESIWAHPQDKDFAALFEREKAKDQARKKPKSAMKVPGKPAAKKVKQQQLQQQQQGGGLRAHAAR